MENKPLKSNLESPFFLVGAVRSGTTLLRLLLGHHPDVCRCEEMEYVTPELVKQNGIPEDLDSYREFLSTDKNFLMSGYSLPDNSSFVETAKSFFHQLQFKDGKPIVGATVHHHYEKLPLVWPDAKFIFLIRDPRDVARSCVKMGFCGSAWYGADFWVNAYDSWLALSENLAEDKKLEISYEELIADPEVTLTTVCSFLGLEYVESMIEIDKDTTYSKPDARQARSWRQSATNEEIIQVESRVADRLKRSGYDHSGLPGLKMNLYENLRINILDLVSRVSFKWNRYGFFLWLMTVLSNRLPFDNFRKKIQLQVQDIDISYHK